MVPPPKPTTKAPTYSVVVNEVPVKELLLAVARDTKQNIDIHPGLQGVVSLNAINETLPAILDRVSKQVNMRYKLEANTIIVSPDTAYMKTYKVNYVNMTRETTSTIGVSGQIGGAGTSSTSGATPGAGGGTGSAGQANASSTIVKTVSNNNFWDSMRDNIRAILVSTAIRASAPSSALNALNRNALQGKNDCSRPKPSRGQVRRHRNYSAAFSAGKRHRFLSLVTCARISSSTP